MSTEANERLVRRQFEIGINGRDLTVLDDLADDFVDHGAPEGLPPGREGTRIFLTALFGWASDLQVEILDLVAQGDRVVVRNRWTGTHEGPIFGHPPTGRRFEMDGIVMWRVAEGRLAERWAVLDRFALEAQLRAASAPAAP